MLLTLQPKQLSDCFVCRAVSKLAKYSVFQFTEQILDNYKRLDDEPELNALSTVNMYQRVMWSQKTERCSRLLITDRARPTGNDRRSERNSFKAPT